MEKQPRKLKMVLAKGRIFDSLLQLLAEAGVSLQVGHRSYRPVSSDPELEVKILKPQNIGRLVELGAHDLGFTGHDWIAETRVEVEEMLDTGLDQVRLSAAVPAPLAEQDRWRRQKLIVASEFENLSCAFLTQQKLDYVFLRTHGATEVFPPEDADMIVDLVSSGETLVRHQLKEVACLLKSSTRMIANREALKDPWKREKIEALAELLKAVLTARGKVLLEMNVPPERLAELVAILPCMRSPTVSQLFGNAGYAVKAAVDKKAIPRLIPILKSLGATDILEYTVSKIML